MWFLNGLSAIYADSHRIVTEYPVLIGIWSGLMFLGGLIPRKWLLEKLRLLWPLDQVPLSVAGSYMLGNIEGGLAAGMARRGKAPEEVLMVMAYYVSNNAKVTALMPPSSKRIEVHPEEFNRGVFRDGGNCFHYHHSDLPKYTELAVRRWLLWRAVREVKRNEENIFPKKNLMPWER